MLGPMSIDIAVNGLGTELAACQLARIQGVLDDAGATLAGDRTDLYNAALIRFIYIMLMLQYLETKIFIM